MKMEHSHLCNLCLMHTDVENDNAMLAVNYLINGEGMKMPIILMEIRESDLFSFYKKNKMDFFLIVVKI